MLLKEFSPGQSGKIVGFRSGQSAYRKRLFSLGILPGTVFEVIRIAPLGDPVEIKVRGSYVSVRKDEIELLEVEKI